jgi:hypothetical protein
MPACLLSGIGLLLLLLDDVFALAFASGHLVVRWIDVDVSAHERDPLSRYTASWMPTDDKVVPISGTSWGQPTKLAHVEC